MAKLPASPPLYIFAAMRGMFSQLKLAVFPSDRSSISPAILLSFLILFSGVFSGCASVSAGNSAAEPVAAKISVVPSVIDFKAVIVGQKNSQTVKITNSSSNSINLKSLQVAGSGFSLSSIKAPVVLAPGQRVDLSVVFAPPSAADHSGSLVISAPELKAPVTVPLSGAGERATPALTISPTSVNFGSRAVKTSTAQTVILTNTGNLSLSISSINVASPAFSVSGVSKGVSLSPNQKIEFQVWFHPGVAGRASTTIAFDSSVGLPPLKLAVSGSASNSTGSSPSAAVPHSVTLGWNASNSAAGYHVYRSEVADGPFNRINAGQLQSTSYKDSDVVGGGQYYYVVTAVGESGSESTYSNEVAVVIPTN
jgi:hypothetical protein